jgi:hypothetical protein
MDRHPGPSVRVVANFLHSQLQQGSAHPLGISSSGEASYCASIRTTSPSLASSRHLVAVVSDMCSPFFANAVCVSSFVGRRR